MRHTKLGTLTLFTLLLCGFSAHANAQSGWSISSDIYTHWEIKHGTEIVASNGGPSNPDPEAASASAGFNASTGLLSLVGHTYTNTFHTNSIFTVHATGTYSGSGTPPDVAFAVQGHASGGIFGQSLSAFAHSDVLAPTDSWSGDTPPASYNDSHTGVGSAKINSGTTLSVTISGGANADNDSADVYASVYWLYSIASGGGGTVGGGN